MHKLRSIANQVLGIDVPPNQPLMESGLDSLAAVELQTVIGATFPSNKVPATFVYDYPTLSAMAEYLLGMEVHSMRGELPSRIAVNATPNGLVDSVSESTTIINVSCRYPQEIFGTIFQGLIHSLRAFADDVNDT